MTFASGGQRSIQLSYGRKKSNALSVNFECAILLAQRYGVQPSSNRFADIAYT